MAKKVETLIAQEFSFVQELVWLPPCRNPFPRCTEKVLSDYGKLEVLYKRLLSSLKSEKDDQKQPDSKVRSTYRNLKALVDRAAAIFESDAKPLIKFRRSFCKRVVFRTNINYPAELYDLEREADSLITQYLERARGLTTTHINSIEKWTRSIKPIQFSQLEAAFQKRFCSFIGSVNIDQQECRENMESLPIGENLAEEDEADLTNLYSGGHNIVSNIFDMPSPTDITCEHQYEKAEKRNRTVKNRNLHLEMTMKAILCPGLHTTRPGENCWHVIFGLVNHDECAVAVQSLSYWSLNDAHHHHHQHRENSSRSDPEVYTIKWPKGGVILKQSPAFLCYGCQIHCRSFSDSPRVVYSWQYRAVPQRHNSSAITRGNNIGAVGGQYLKRSTKFATIQDGVIGTDYASSGDVEVVGKATLRDDDLWPTSILISEEGSIKDEDNKDECDQSEDEFQSRIGQSTAERNNNPLYKRLGSLIWSRLGNPLKKAKVDGDGE